MATRLPGNLEVKIGGRFDGPDILTVEDLRHELKIGRVQAYNLAHAIPHIRVGKSIRIRRAALEQWQAEQEGKVGR